MSEFSNHSIVHRLKLLFIGDARNVKDSKIFHKISLIAILAWVGLGADGLSSSCYGPQEAFLALGNYHYLGLFVALGTAITITVISMSYSQTIELFPSGGGGYLVASKLHSPFVGMVSGSALLIDYVLTISVSIAGCADAIFSFLPPQYLYLKIYFSIFVIGFMILINLRGVKESIAILAPIFLLFVLTHLFAILYSIFYHSSDFNDVITKATVNINDAHTNLGLFGVIFLIMKAFSMGAGTFTGIEAVSNGLPVLREPRVQTGKRTMRLMAASLAFTAVGLMIAYFLFGVEFQHGKTLNAVLFENLSANWGIYGNLFVWITLISEAAILIVAAQAGFLDGPRILSNMATDKWMPSGFAMLSDRLVTRNGILLMGLFAVLIVIITKGSLVLLVLLYSINVFITFILTESGMVRHWWQVRKTEKKWMKKLSVNATALLLDTFILTFIIIFKFNEGGWVTILATGSVVILAVKIKKHYTKVGNLLSKLNELSDRVKSNLPTFSDLKNVHREKILKQKTAIILVNGYNGLGINLLMNTVSKIGDIYHRYIFVQVGVVDTGNFKGSGDADKLNIYIKTECQKYVDLMLSKGYESEAYTSIGTDIIEEVYKIINELQHYYLDVVVVSGRIAFEKENIFKRFLHNNLVFRLQKQCISNNIPFIIFPVHV
ncbi:MAG: APC family permease [bacterium]